LIAGKLELRQLGVAADHLQDVVEIVGHAAGQLPQRVHLLGVAQCLAQAQPISLDALFFAQVGEEHHDAGETLVHEERAATEAGGES